MENISYVGLSQQIALQREMDVTASNIANMNTAGYKSQGILFLDYLNHPKNGDTPIKQVEDYGSYRDLATGSFKQTFNRLDFAIEGEGYFAVQTPAGLRYTRDGGFSLDANRNLVTKSGYPVQGDGGPISIQADATDIHVTADGTVTTDKGSVGKIKVVTFANRQALKPTGDNLYDSGKEQEQPVDSPRVEQGMIENSNVNPIVEMNKMIRISRMYEAAQHMIMSDHERMLTAIQKLTQV